MAIIVVEDQLTKEKVDSAREDYENYIKITADLDKNIVAIGGEYHADAEKVLTENFGSKRSNVWGGGYDILSDKFEVNAIINIRGGMNDSPDILDPKIRDEFLKLVKEKLKNIKSFV